MWFNVIFAIFLLVTSVCMVIGGSFLVAFFIYGLIQYFDSKPEDRI